VAELAPERNQGFLVTKEGGLLYFHRNAILTGDFDKLPWRRGLLRRGRRRHWADGDQGLGERRVSTRSWGFCWAPAFAGTNGPSCACIHRTATMNSRGKRSSTLPSNRGL
jgi:hypothetical protein